MYTYSNNQPDKKLQKYFIIAALIGIVPFLYFAVIGYFDWTDVTAQDYKISAFFYKLHNPLRNFVATWITHLADQLTQIGVALVVVVVLFLYRKWRTALWYGLTALFGAYLLNGFVKEFYQRLRPDQIEPLVEIGGFSFPSGHAMGSVIVYGGILFLVIRSVRSHGVKWFFGIFTGLLILVIGLSRIYLAVHFPSDVMGGFSLGFAWLCLSIAFFGLKFTRQEFRPKNPYSMRRLR